MRRTACLSTILLALALGACGGDDDKDKGSSAQATATQAPTATTPGATTSTATAPAKTTPSTTSPGSSSGGSTSPSDTSPSTPSPTTPSGLELRKPAGGETVRVRGTVSEVESVGFEGVSQKFLLRSASGNAGFDVAVPQSLALSRPVRSRLLNPDCAGKVVGRFRVRGTEPGATFDWTLIAASVIRDDCG